MLPLYFLGHQASVITLKSELEALKFDYEKKLQGLTEETSIFKQEAARRELDIELYINELYNKLKVRVVLCWII